MAFYVGIEIGGTKLQIAVGRGEGEAFHKIWRGAVDASRGAARIRQQIVEGIDELLTQAELGRDRISGVGIGFGGPVDTVAGRVVTSNQVAGWDEFPITNWFIENFGWPAVLHNDADTAAYAEARFGAGKGFDPVLYMTVGSGIGGGLICGGKIYRGSGAGATEIGHLRPDSLLKQAAQSGASVEAMASGFGIEERARRIVVDWMTTIGGAGNQPVPEQFATLMRLANGEPGQITTLLIAQAAAEGDCLSRELLSNATDTLGWALAQAITLLNPARIVLGGGVSLIGEELFFAPVRRACQAQAFKPFIGIADIVPANLGEEVVVHGAMALARVAFDK